MKYDVIVIGSGAGGSAVAFHLTQTGKRVLLLEKGLALPRDGSTLDVEKVLRKGAFLSDEPWVDGKGRMTVPEEHFNLGGKTKWYGAALLRFAPHEFDADPAHQCPAWPFGHATLAPFYEEAEQLLGVHHFAVEPNTAAIGGRPAPAGSAVAQGAARARPVRGHPGAPERGAAFRRIRVGARPQGRRRRVAPRARDEEVEPGSVDRQGGFEADPRGGRRDADRRRGVRGRQPLHRRYRRARRGRAAQPAPVADLSRSTGLAATLPCYANVGSNYKSHVLTALMALSHRPVTDVLCKTLLLYHDDMPHSTVQTLGGNLTEEIIRAQFPGFVPDWIARGIARRFYGFFLQTEDGSHPDNRIVAGAGAGNRPQIDYDLDRITPAQEEHRRLVRTLRKQLLRMGYLAVAKSIPVSGTAHACGTLAAGNDPASSVVDGDGKVHGMANLYVGDGSVLPRSSRVNPALSIYAWGLRLGARLGTPEREREVPAARTGPAIGAIRQTPARRNQRGSR